MDELTKDQNPYCNKNHEYNEGNRVFMNVDESLIRQWGSILQIDMASIASCSKRSDFKTN